MIVTEDFRLFSYIVSNDYGLAPNPFWGQLTLTVCKPVIRRTAKVGDWIIGTGSKNVLDQNGNKRNHSGRMVFAMKVDRIMSLKAYDEYCTRPNSDLKYKRPHTPFFDKDWRHKVGDCIYDYSDLSFDNPRLRRIIHTEEDKPTDISGENALISNHFYYFGNSTVKIENENLIDIVKNEQGHLAFDTKNLDHNNLIEELLKWLIENYEENKVYDNPQMYWDIDELIKRKKKCSKLKKIYNLDN